MTVYSDPVRLNPELLSDLACKPADQALKHEAHQFSWLQTLKDSFFAHAMASFISTLYCLFLGHIIFAESGSALFSIAIPAFLLAFWASLFLRRRQTARRVEQRAPGPSEELLDAALQFLARVARYDEADRSATVLVRPMTNAAVERLSVAVLRDGGPWMDLVMEVDARRFRVLQRCEDGGWLEPLTLAELVREGRAGAWLDANAQPVAAPGVWLARQAIAALSQTKALPSPHRLWLNRGDPSVFDLPREGFALTVDVPWSAISDEPKGEYERRWGLFALTGLVMLAVTIMVVMSWAPGGVMPWAWGLLAIAYHLVFAGLGAWSPGERRRVRRPVQSLDESAGLLTLTVSPLRLEHGGRGLSLEEPFSVVLYRTNTSAPMVVVEVMKTEGRNPAERLRFQVAVSPESPGLESLPVLNVEAPMVDAEAMRTKLWPALSACAQLHGVSVPWHFSAADGAERVSVEAVVAEEAFMVAR